VIDALGSQRKLYSIQFHNPLKFQSLNVIRDSIFVFIIRDIYHFNHNLTFNFLQSQNKHTFISTLEYFFKVEN
jgi:hypothetical protein